MKYVCIYNIIFKHQISNRINVDFSVKKGIYRKGFKKNKIFNKKNLEVLKI